MGLVLLIIGLVLDVACFAFLIKKLVNFCHSHVIGEEKGRLSEDDNKKFLYFIVAQAITTIISSIGFVLALHLEMNAVEYLLLILGSIIFGGSIDILVSSFVLYYYRPDLVEEQKKLVRKTMFFMIPIVLIGLIMLTEGFARSIEYPLPNGISFTEGILYPGENGGFSIAWYGVMIVGGALISYFVCDHYIYKKYKKHGLIDTLFVVAFIGGIIGARLWFCYVLEPAEYVGNFGKVFDFVNGLSGLAIQGGAILGMLTGIAFVLIFRRYIDLRFIMDVAIPSILIAQAVGRWGNFFNQEVYGFVVSEKSLWFLPTIIKNNMYIDFDYRLPLFLIEGIINLGGYFFIRYFLGKACNFHLGLGYQASFYLIWYGTVRAILEPLREGFTLQVGSSEAFGYMQSWIVAFSMIGGGILLFFVFFFIHKLRMKKGLENQYGEKI